MTSSPQALGRIPALDGVRAVGVLLVLGFHAGLPGFHGGRAGVDVFFVLSGFLITSVLIGEYARRGRIDLRAFYLRRAFRLLPALVAVIVFAVALAALRIPVFGSSSRPLENTLKGIGPALFYLTNIVRAFRWFEVGTLGHTWSLAIEEQYYLVWPIVLIVLYRRRPRPAALFWLAAAGAIGSALARGVLVATGTRTELTYNFTLTHVDGVLAGCALAMGWAYWRDHVSRLASPAIPIVLLAVGVPVVIAGRQMEDWGFAVIGLLTVLLIIDLVARPQSAMAEVFRTRPMVEIGKRSYGLYLYHWPIFLFIGIDRRPHMLALGFGLSFLVAWLSYAFIERPFLAMKDRRFASVADSPRAVPENRA